MYTKAEMIDILSQMNTNDRNKLVRQWVFDKKVPYTSALSANHAVVKAMKEQQRAEALAKGLEPPKRINAAAPVPPPKNPRKRQKQSSHKDGEIGGASTGAEATF
jgi:hypothetical protein